MTDSPDVLSNDELPALRFLLQFCLRPRRRAVQ